MEGANVNTLQEGDNKDDDDDDNDNNNNNNNIMLADLLFIYL